MRVESIKMDAHPLRGIDISKAEVLEPTLGVEQVPSPHGFPALAELLL
jgi:hypothetical protein